jgi:hypothetical protein
MMLTAEHKQQLADQVRFKLHTAVEQARLEVLLAQTNLRACEDQLAAFEAGLKTEQTNAG